MDRFIFFSVLALVLIFPVFFGGNVNWAWDSFALLSSLLLVLWGAGFFINKSAGIKFRQKLQAPFLLFTLVLLWIAIQGLVPVPKGWANPMWGEAEAVLGVTLPHVISIEPGRTITGLVRLISYGMIFFLVLQTTRRPEQVVGALKAFAAAAALYAGYGLYIQLTGAATVLGYDKFYYPDSLTSTFINRNSYATYAGFGLLAITTLGLQGWVTITSRAPTGNIHGRWVLLSEYLSRHWWLILAWAIVLTALLLTGSRAGMVTTLAALIALLVIYIGGRRHSLQKGLLAIAGLFAVLAGVVLFSGKLVLARLLTLFFGDGNEAIRASLYDQGMQIIRDYPLTGTGYDTYPFAFYLYRGMDVEFSLRSVHAHNTYLENAIELGIPAAVILALVFVMLFWTCTRGIHRRRRYFMLPVLGLVITLQIALHSLVDFSMEMPGVAATYAFLMALAVSQCWPKPRPGPGPRSKDQ
ncbi:MAG: O-antigen ligase family protein [Proteobacteria bacterium]|nr:O-antigen ligase family protein [Pseudomonadota bacterium]